MPYEMRELDFHLTPAGWTKNEIAADYTVETWRLSVHQESAWSKPQQAWRRIWQSLAWSETERERLRRTFPLPAEVRESLALAQLTTEGAARKRA